MPELRNLQFFSRKEVDYEPLIKTKLDFWEISCDEKIFSIVGGLETLKSLRLHCVDIPISIEGIEKLVNLTRLELLDLNCYDISPIASLDIEVLEIEVPEDCNLTPLKVLTKLKL